MSSHPLLILDADETLWAVNDIYVRAYEQAFEAIANSIIQQKVLFDFNAKSAKEILTAIDGVRRANMEFSISRFEESLVIVYAILCGYCGANYHVDCEQHLRRIGSSVFNFVPKVFQDTIPALKKFSKHFYVVALTTGDRGIQAEKFMNTGLAKYFDVVFVTGRKTKEVFKRVLSWVSGKMLPFTSVWMIGNSFTFDLKPALEAGVHSVLVKRSGEDDDFFLGDKNVVLPNEVQVVASLEDAFEMFEREGIASGATAFDNYEFEERMKQTGDSVPVISL